MATFVVLPPRELVEHAVHSFVETLLPGLPVPAGLWERVVAEVLAGADVYTLFREDLPESDDPSAAFVDGFGAEPGDRVREVTLPRGGKAGPVKTWAVAGPVAKLAG